MKKKIDKTKSSTIDILTMPCDRCGEKTVSLKHRTGVSLTHKDHDIYLCNDCAEEMADLIKFHVQENRKKRGKKKDRKRGNET